MQMTDRIRQMIEANIVNHYIPLVVKADVPRVFPMYFARIMEENIIAFPATGATRIDELLSEMMPAYAMVSDRNSGYEAYLLEGKARYVNHDQDFQLVMEMRNDAVGFPIHGAVVFEVERAHLAPPP